MTTVCFDRARRLWLVLGLAHAVAVSAGPGVAHAAASLKIAVLPMVVHSAESPEYLRQGLADMLASRLDQVELFQVIRVEDPKRATTRLDAALETARTLGADLVLFGSFTRFGQGASLDVQAASTAPEANGETLREIFVHSGSIGEVIPDLDDLVGKVTRFAVPGYAAAAPSAAAGAAAPAPSSRALEDLSNRVQSLEEAVETLKAARGK